jgi:hypothetical protein
MVLELIIDPVCALVFEERAAREPDAMDKPPRDPREALFGCASDRLLPRSRD